jgi:hypothetical protein
MVAGRTMMQYPDKFVAVTRVGMIVVIVTGILWVHPRAYAQTLGNNIVYDQYGNCCTDGPSGGNGSYAFVDASVFDGTNGYPSGDICYDIFEALSTTSDLLPGSPMAVVDARGVPQSSGGYTCTDSLHNPITPWVIGTSTVYFPGVILLPAGPISIGITWIIPSGTRIIGEGANTAATGTGGTILSASSWAGSTSMLQFGQSATYVCPDIGGNFTCDGIGLEDLTLDANSTLGLDGILNQNSQERTYVNRVSLRNFKGVGLKIYTDGKAQDSGPYSNITFRGVSGFNSTCVWIVSSSSVAGNATRGIHGIKCIGGGSSDSTGIYLLANGNSLEDVLVSGFTDGVLIGGGSVNQVAKGNFLLNITGDSTVQNVIHICGSLDTLVSCPHNNVGDLTILQAARNGTRLVCVEVAG